MTPEVAERLIEINPYVMGAVLVGAIILAGGAVHVAAWLVRHIITRKDSENDSIISDLKTAIDGLRISQEANTRDLRATMTEISTTTAEMASFIREKLDETASRIHGRIDKLTKNMTDRLDETNCRITAESMDRARLGVVLSSGIAECGNDIATIQGRCDARAQMCPHIQDGNAHCGNRSA